MTEKTNTVYVCDICGRKHDTAEEANACEKECRKKLEALTAKKNSAKKSEDQINQIYTLIDKHNEEFPDDVIEVRRVRMKTGEAPDIVKFLLGL